MIKARVVLLPVLAAAALAVAGPTTAATPQLVQAYVDSLVKQCGGELTPALSSQVVQQIDLNGDRIDDWVIDGSAFPCPKRPAVFADQGSLITIFLGAGDGRAQPALQRAGFGAHLERRPDASFALFLTLAGADCGEDNPKTRCDRQVQWQAAQHRLDLAPLPRASAAANAKSQPRSNAAP